MRYIKILRLFIHILTGITLTFILAGLLRQSPSHKNYRHLKAWWFSYASSIFGVEVTTFGTQKNETALVVSNHISWLDIPVLGGVINPYFLSKASIKNWPLFGWLAVKAGTLFIHRGNRTSALKIKQEMTESLVSILHVDTINQTENQATNKSILFFPEGTTTNGVDIKKYKSRLFQSAIDANVPIQPILIRYPDYAQNPYRTNLAIPFIGDLTMLQSLWQILGEKKIKAEVYFLTPELSEGMTQKDLATNSENSTKNQLASLIQPRIPVEQSVE